MKKQLASFLLLVLTLSAFLSLPAGARTYPDANLNPATRPGDAMRIDEFIALISHVSYWSKGVSGPYATDKTGSEPIAWAAPYVQSEIDKGVVHAQDIEYAAPATVAYAAKYLSNARGLYHWDYVNRYDVKETDGLSAEEKMYLNVAFDHKLIGYYEGISATTVLKRSDIPALLLDKPFEKVAPKTLVSDGTEKNLHVFFENNGPKMDYQYNLLQKYSGAITQVSFFPVKNTSSFAYPVVDFDKPVQKQAIEYCKQNGLQTFLVLDNYNFFAQGDSYAVYDKNIIDSILNNSDACIAALIGTMNQYGMDGINVTFDMFDGDHRAQFSAFMEKLSGALKAQNKLLMVSAGAFIKEADENESSYDYDVLGKNCDFVHIILYDHNSANAYNSGRISAPGCNSNLVYIDRVLKYAIYKMPAEKILLGTQSFSVAFDTASRSAANVPFDSAWLSSPGLVYDETEGSGHIVSGTKTIYFETERGMKERLLRAYEYGLSGMSSYSLTSEFAPIFTLTASKAQ